MTDFEIYKIYAKESFKVFVKGMGEKTAVKTISKIWNTYLDRTEKDDFGAGYYLGSEEDIKKFFSETDYIKASLEYPEISDERQLNKPFNEMLNKFVYVAERNSFRFLGVKELVDLMIDDVSDIYLDVIASPENYSNELYSYAIYPHILEGGIVTLHKPDAAGIWETIKRIYKYTTQK